MIRRVSSTAAMLGMLALFGDAVAVAQSRSADHSAHLAHAAASDGAGLDFTVNIAISDTEIQPSAVFVPAGRPVQLLVRNRGSVEHHYRVVGLVPDEIAWLKPGADDGSGESHDHHGRTFVPWRDASPAGIRPSGREVHAYVTPERHVDEVLFTATEPGTYLVQCDLHPGQVARLTVFEPQAARPATVGAASAQALHAVLTRELGRVTCGANLQVCSPETSAVHVEATYAPEDDRYVSILLTERLHTATLPRPAGPPTLLVNGTGVPLLDAKVVTDSVHHRATSYRFARDGNFGRGHQVMTLRLASAREATWHLPLLLPTASSAGGFSARPGEEWGLILALLGGMLAAMWPCLFQLTVYFIPALAGVAVQESDRSVAARRGQVLRAAFYFILGFTLIYTATGAVIGYAAQRFGDTSQFEAWQRWIGVAAGIVVIGLAVRVAAKARAPLVCRMPVLSSMARSRTPATRTEMMLAGLAFATGCMTCFGSALVVGMVVYIGLAQSALYGAVVLFLFSLGMGVPLVIAAVAMARALPLLLKLETAVPWMGLTSAVLMAAFGVLLLSGNYMLVSEWTYRVISH
jgi:cytochrome c-type biogenesis protein